MSLPREWSLHHNQQQLNQDLEERYSCRRMIDNRTVPSILTASFQEMVRPALIDENMNQHHNQLGSLFSIHSAPVYDVCNTGSNSPKSHYHDYRPASLVVQTTATSTPIVPPHLSPPETLEDEDNDNLLTISSVTARPLIAKSRELSKRTGVVGTMSKRKLKKAKKEAAKRRRQRLRKMTFNPLDGGYGWIIVLGAFFVQFWVAGLVKSYGVLYVEVMERFTDSSASVASWIPAILACLCLALAPITSMLSQKYSCRVVVFVGGLFCSLGLIISYFATSLIHLFFTFGVLTGIGGGLSTTPGIILVSQYFDKHRALANGICVSGTAAGSIIFPMLIEYLVASFGFHGTFLILGGCMLHVCVSASLYRPLDQNYAIKVETKLVAKINSMEREAELEVDSKRQKLEMLFAYDQIAKNNIINELFHQNVHVNELAMELTDSEEEKDIMGKGLSTKPISKIRSSSILHSVEDLSTDSTCVYKSRSSQSSSGFAVCTGTRDSYNDTQGQAEVTSIACEQSASKESLAQRFITRYIELGLLRELRFIMMCLSVTLMSTGSPYMLYYLPAYVHARGYTKPEAGYLVAISATLDLCGRLGLGWLSDLQLFDRRKGYIGSIVGAGVAVLVIPMAHSFYVLACSVGMYGLCLGCWFLLVPVLLADQYGTEKISSSYGLVRMFQSIGAVTIPPLAGFMRDITGSYNICFVFMGTCMVLGSLPLLFVSNDTTCKNIITKVSNVTENEKADGRNASNLSKE